MPWKIASDWYDRHRATEFQLTSPTVSADPATRDAVRRYVVASNGIDLYEADYQPHDEKEGFWAPQKPVNHIGIA